MLQNNARAPAFAIAAAALYLVCANTQADSDSGRVGVENADISVEAAAKPAPTYSELEAEIAAYRQYHAEEELLACLRTAKSDPGIRGTHKVGPRLKQLEVQQRRYADFRKGSSGLSPEDRRQVERKIVQLHLEQKKHIDFVRGLFANGLTTTNNALLEYHDTGCIDGLDKVVEEIRNSGAATRRPATASEASP